MMETGLRTYMWHFFASEQPPVQQCANDTTLTILKGVLKMRGLTMEQNLERIRYMTAWVPLFPSCASLRKLSLLSLSFLMWNLSIKIPISQHCCKAFHVTGIWQNVEPVGCSPWGRQESGTTEGLHFHFSLSCIGEGNGNPLQCSCLENPRDWGAWWASVYGVAQSWTWLKRLSSSSSSSNSYILIQPPFYM